MKKYLAVLAFLISSLPAKAITVASAGTAGINNGSASTLATSAYNQSAHHCIVAFVNGFNGSAITAPTDTSTDTFTNVVPLYAGGNSNHIGAWIAYNVAGNSSNIVTSNLGATLAYATLQTYDVNAGTGNCTSAQLDVHAKITTTSSGTSASQTITTAVANEAITTAVYSSGSAAFTAATAPTGFTAGSIVAQYGDAAYEVVSSIQTGVTLTWSSLAPTTTYDMLTVSLEQNNTSTACQPKVTAVGAGGC